MKKNSGRLREEASLVLRFVVSLLLSSPNVGLLVLKLLGNNNSAIATDSLLLVL